MLTNYPFGVPARFGFAPKACLMILMLVWSMLIGVAPAMAQIGGPSRANHISATLVSESPTPAPGKTTMLAFVMQPEPTWHGYFENPGDAGLGMTLDWKLPPGVSVGATHYPVPKTLVISGIMNYVYESDYAPLVELTVDSSVASGTKLPISVDAQWLACTDEICVPEQAKLSITLVAGDGTVSAADQMRFDGLRARLPAPLGSPARFASDGKTFKLAVPLPATATIEAPYFFILNDQLVDYGAPQMVRRDGDTLFIETDARGTGPEKIEGLLKIGENMGLWVEAVRGSVTVSGAQLAGVGEGGDAVLADGNMFILLLGALGGAILGGLILNVMPCVFPILSLKAISLAKAGGDGTTAKREALAYTAGIILVCIGLGGLMLGLRAVGEQIGWAFQLQDPRIVLLLLLLVTAIAFNLAGLFEITSVSAGGSLTSKGGTRGAFWTGALAAFVATPCTAPFMAGAIGTALILPIAGALLVFAGLGLGLALPFLLIAYVPALRARMPRPGPWMSTFRHVMAIPMFLTALALAWLLGQQTGNDGLLLGLASAMGLALLLWWLGTRQHAGKDKAWVLATPALGLALAAALALPMSDENGGAAQSAENAADKILKTEPFDGAKLASLRSEGRPVFLYFTADWCITCKANEASALQRADTAAAFAKANVAVLEGDWTRRDPEISRFLESQGRSGVPLYLYYAPGQDAEVLPQVLTVGALRDLVS